MPIRNIWSLEPGECITAESILEKVKDCDVYFPLHDVGVDLLVVKEDKHVGVQVKESRYFTSRILKGTRGHSWHQVDKRKIERYRKEVDFYVFLTYLPRYGEYSFSSFEYKFVIVPTSELQERIKAKDPGKKGKYSFYFYFDGPRVLDMRDKVEESHLRDYSKYLDAWHLITEALK
jgi:hypothetical protein